MPKEIVGETIPWGPYKSGEQLVPLNPQRIHEKNEYCKIHKCNFYDFKKDDCKAEPHVQYDTGEPCCPNLCGAVRVSEFNWKKALDEANKRIASMECSNMDLFGQLKMESEALAAAKKTIASQDEVIKALQDVNRNLSKRNKAKVGD